MSEYDLGYAMSGGVVPAMTYTVNGTVMPPLEYIDYLHGQLSAKPVARVTRIIGRERAEIMGYCEGGLSMNMALYAVPITTPLVAALQKIATVNATDYEYQRWAREALAAQEKE
jgi:poly(3-hydroxyalkanoate) synthetase